ncbi:hypothetical protein DVH24_042245 [Malus domestica]|uniref:Uncharacterized protein n=1 Tax=Malus domestica TaxID=3750 RepID=A0A498J1D9_MALDO|nr:hypothetical protein DVH24_042245 [Malus domestica]
MEAIKTIVLQPLNVAPTAPVELSDSKAVPKKYGITMVNNDNKEVVPTRVTRVGGFALIIESLMLPLEMSTSRYALLIQSYLNQILHLRII